VSENADEIDRVAYQPPSVKWGGYYFGKDRGPHKLWVGDQHPCVHHSVYVKEIETQRSASGLDFNGDLLSSLLYDLLERHDGGYEGFDRGEYSIRSFCWCERPDCPWCEHGEWYFKYPAINLCASWYKHCGRGLETSRPYTAAEIEAARLALKVEKP
jgi:hypothetical protein